MFVHVESYSFKNKKEGFYEETTYLDSGSDIS